MASDTSNGSTQIYIVWIAIASMVISISSLMFGFYNARANEDIGVHERLAKLEQKLDAVAKEVDAIFQQVVRPRE